MLEIHIAIQHVLYSPYNCEHCQTAQFPSDYALRRHYLIDHRQQVFNIKYRVSPELDRRQALLTQLLKRSLGGSSDVNLPIEDTSKNMLFGFQQSSNKSLELLNQPISKSLNTMNYSSSYRLTKFIIEDNVEVQNGKSLNPTSFTPQKQVVENELDSGDDNNSVYGNPIGAKGKTNFRRRNAITYMETPPPTLSNDSIQTGKLLKQNDFATLKPVVEVIQVQTGSNEPILKNEYEDCEEDYAQMTMTQKMLQILNTNSTSPIGNRNSKSKKRRISEEIQNDEGGFGIEDKAKPRVVCAECNRKVGDYLNSHLLHVSTHHFETPMFECNGCDKKWFSLSARTREHMKSTHNSDMSLLKDNRADIMAELKLKASLCFPKS